MPPFSRTRRLLGRVIPLFGHYAANAAQWAIQKFPKAAPFVERILDKGLSWGSNVAQSLNINPTFGSAPVPGERFVPAVSRQDIMRAPPGSREIIESINVANRASQSQTPMGGLGAGPWKYYPDIPETTTRAPTHMHEMKAEMSRIGKAAAAKGIGSNRRKQGPPKIPHLSFGDNIGDYSDVDITQFIEPTGVPKTVPAAKRPKVREMTKAQRAAYDKERREVARLQKAAAKPKTKRGRAKQTV